MADTQVFPDSQNTQTEEDIEEELELLSKKVTGLANIMAKGQKWTGEFEPSEAFNNLLRAMKPLQALVLSIIGEVQIIQLYTTGFMKYDNFMTSLQGYESPLAEKIRSFCYVTFGGFCYDGERFYYDRHLCYQRRTLAQIRTDIDSNIFPQRRMTDRQWEAQFRFYGVSFETGEDMHSVAVEALRNGLFDTPCRLINVLRDHLAIRYAVECDQQKLDLLMQHVNLLEERSIKLHAFYLKHVSVYIRRCSEIIDELEEKSGDDAVAVVAMRRRRKEVLDELQRGFDL